MKHKRKIMLIPLARLMTQGTWICFYIINASKIKKGNIGSYVTKEALVWNVLMWFEYDIGMQLGVLNFPKRSKW